ncbi:DNA-directed RNA polymerasese, putative [Trichomonas vaginalis G3]|uniref:DNA-directed RNA polymerasese, putative n=1 Tax=Trichomonas vaginalis (strain ATCC PRA-98 / G3) TaxID=412133 RepID=A2EWQ0_TRIV3|nr:RNA polymerase ii, chain L domain-containing protein [Trichomonas vaginalis G3]EAY02938.1 DNA-directed RNA polymerasese, putative [Trichomonas vaginalis G3]KAI5521788.1 RNA polymerase ii, chain L domain-containing protein [Trichomonas vaginalis G3]|eukprot:XP_001315161.1 DNA-directed RNA polymerasese [Trichomonas vaginalis G3]
MVVVEYNCSNCGKTVRAEDRGAMRCPQCGCNILYKKRTTKRITFSAR